MHVYFFTHLVLKNNMIIKKKYINEQSISRPYGFMRTVNSVCQIKLKIK